MMPDVGGTTRSVRLLGRTRAAELVLTGRRFTAEEALSWGLITRVCEPKDALRTARQLGEELAANAPKATREALKVLRAVDSLDDAAAFAMETEGGVRALMGGECIEGVAAFMEKRPPKWRG
jgi:enoyl-CoA hydratase/carnithine racemase